MLVVGPNRTFIEYVSHVLPSLGETSVVQRAIGDLREGTSPAGREDPALSRRKGDAEMAPKLRAAVASHRREPEAELEAMLGMNYVRVPLARVREIAEEAWADAHSWETARERLRMGLLRAFYRAYGDKLGASAMRSFEELEKALAKGGYLKRFVDRILPPLVPERVLVEVLGLPRRPKQWTHADVALLDELDEVIHGRPKAFGHVIVDEAQDLTPMQLRMIARRTTSGWATMLGDIAQSTGPVAYERWDELLDHLPVETAEVEELVLAYRVPSEIMELALPLLPRIAPHARPPEAYRQGGEPPRFLRDDDVPHRAAEESVLLDAGEGSVAVIAALAQVAPIRELLTRALVDVEGSTVEDLAPAVRVLDAREAKGLEFDHVVLAEPAAIVGEVDGVQGLRHLYVALTRATKTLTVVHAQRLPWE